MADPTNPTVPTLRRPRATKPLCLFLFVEVPILLLLHPRFAGNADVARFLTSAGEFFRYFLWPRSPADTESYRFVIFQLCSRVTALPFYPYLKAIAPWILPTWFFLALFIRITGRIRLRRAARGPRPPRPKGKRPGRRPAYNRTTTGAHHTQRAQQLLQHRHDVDRDHDADQPGNGEDLQDAVAEGDFVGGTTVACVHACGVAEDGNGERHHGDLVPGAGVV